MSRLTEYREDLKRYEYKQDEKGYCYISEGQIVNKLGKLEDLEEQLGCPLEVYIRATRSGIWYSTAGVMKHCYVDVIDASKIIFAMKGTNIWFELKKYQKTWWLKEDRSE